MDTTKCKVCGSNAVDVVYASAKDYITKEAFQVRQCQRCSAAFSWPQPDNMAPYYPQKYRRYNAVIGNILEFLYRQRVKGWSKQFSKTGVAFEMGCGDGLMLKTLRSLGWQVIGSERTVESAHFAHQELGLPIFVGGLDTLKPGPYFDLIFLFQVLEHLNDPNETLQKLCALLQPDGKLIIGVPNFNSWQSRLAREKWFHLDVPRHLFHYSLPTLKALLAPYGLQIDSVRYFSPEHDPYGWAQSLLNLIDWQQNRLTKLLMRIDKPNPVNLLHLVLGIALCIVSLPVAGISNLLGQGALIEVVAKASSTK